MNLEINDLIDEVGVKYGYDQELVEVLKRCIPAMIEGKSKEDAKLLMDTLKRVQIYTFDSKPLEEDIENIKKEKFNGRNDDVKTKPYDTGEYGKGVSAGAYISEPVFDENMNIVDRIGFIYVTNLDRTSETLKFYGTKINLSHLIHELGHAWAAQKDEYIQDDEGYTFKVGTGEFYNRVNRETHEVEGTTAKGIYLEEALNSIEEENALYRLERLVNYILEAYDIVFNETTIEELEES